MQKIDQSFILKSYTKGITTYRRAVTEVGLWQSEKYVLENYFQHSDQLLDLGCGAGRTTLGMHQLGFRHLTGIDLNPKMIEAAKAITEQLEEGINFLVGDATQLAFPPATFDGILFSFNGIMTIPGKKQRVQAFQEIYRILKPGGIFIFTTHDREADMKYRVFWESETIRWADGKQDERLHDFGDIIIFSDDVMSDIFIHIPIRAEVEDQLAATGFTLLETFYRPEKFTENEAVKAFSAACRFWVVEKGQWERSRTTTQQLIPRH